jgi:hypothetical protein
MMAAPREPDRFEVLLSAVVLPGAGQWVQGRKAAAVGYGVLSLICAAGELWVVLTPMTANLNRALTMEREGATGEFVSFSIPAILFWFAALLIVYVVNLVDASMAYRRRRRAWLLRQ